MAADFDLPIWRALEDIHEHYMDETSRTAFPAVVADHAINMVVREEIMNSTRFSVDEAILRKLKIRRRNLSKAKRI